LKKVGIVVNRDKDIGYVHTKNIVETLRINGFTPVVPHGAGILSEKDAIVSDSVYKDSDFIICVGGDGTFLKAAREAYSHGIPVLGINRGSVGFLAEVETREIDWAIQRMAEGRMTIQPRMVLDVRVLRDGDTVFRDVAVNDAVVSRVAMSRILNLRVSLDSQYVDSFPGDGVIISSPTGSTGYSLSAGGPIVQPDMRLMIITPICPHILYSRSFIVSENRIVQASIDEKGEIEAMLTVDGQEGTRLEPGDLVEVRSSARDVLFASVCQVNFYDVLRAKIHGRAD
jgi:NAD+ kinase